MTTRINTITTMHTPMPTDSFTTTETATCTATTSRRKSPSAA
jgi:hypothetical protein